MSDNKKDLTRIEDLGEFIHELNEDNESISLDEFSSEVPDLPSEPSDDPFSTEESETEFGSDFESPSEFLSSSDETTEDEAPSWNHDCTDDSP